MANDDFDALLRVAMNKEAESANSAGVADAIRARVADGDIGTTVTGSVAPGWGGSSALLNIIAPIALVVVAGVVGGVMGASGVFGATSGEVDGSVPAYVITPDVAPTYACPGGPQIGNMPANTRVLAVARDADGLFLGTRNPDDWSTTIWFEAGDVVTDDGTDIASLPIGECPEVVVTVVTPTPTPEPTVEPDPGETDEPTPPADTTPPLATKMSATPPLVINGQASQISISATDNVGVTGVALSWSGPNGLTGNAAMVLSGGTWRYDWSYQNMGNGFGNWTFTARASDAAGNLSAPAQVIVNRQYLG